MELQEHPSKLYHYTSQQGLKGILESKKLWMTNILYLNDSSEFTHTLDLVMEELDNQIKLIGNNKNNILDEIKQYIFLLIKDVFNRVKTTDKRTEYYVFSLSESPDDLSQWRGYCPNVGGFCIEFDYKKIHSILESKNIKTEIVQCIYEPSDKKEIVKSLIYELSSEIYKLEKYKGRKINQFINVFYDNFKEISSKIKQESFKNEKEYRIVYVPPTDETKKLREGKSMLIPYIELGITNEEKVLPISKIIVGYTPHPELSKLSVRYLLESLESEGYNVSEIDVEYFKSSYRGIV